MSEHPYQDDDQGRQHHEAGDQVDGDDPLALGRDAGEGLGAEQGHGTQDRYHVDHYDREDVVDQVHEGCLQAYLRVLSDDRERRENYRECSAEVGADGDRNTCAGVRMPAPAKGTSTELVMVEDWVRTVTPIPEAIAR